IARSGGRRRRNRGVQAEEVRLLGAGEVQPGYARQQDGNEIAAVDRVDRLQRAPIEEILEARDFRRRIQRLELCVVLRVRPVPSILLPERDDDLVDEWLAETRNLDPLAMLIVSAVRFKQAQVLPARARANP